MQHSIPVDAALAVYARVPLLGAVKTRLAAGVGAAAALQFYQEMLIHTLQQARRQVSITVLGGIHVAGLAVPSGGSGKQPLPMGAACRCAGVRCTVYHADPRDGPAMAEWLGKHHLVCLDLTWLST